MALYILLHICICKCIQYMSLCTRKPGVTSPTIKALICTDIAAKALQFTHGLIQQFVIIELSFLNDYTCHSCSCMCLWTESTYDLQHCACIYQGNPIQHDISLNFALITKKTPSFTCHTSLDSCHSVRCVCIFLN